MELSFWGGVIIYYSLNGMNEISSLNALSLNHYQNAQLQKQYQQHVNKILEISDKKPMVRKIAH